MDAPNGQHATTTSDAMTVDAPGSDTLTHGCSPPATPDGMSADAASIAHLWTAAVVFSSTGLAMIPCPFCGSDNVGWRHRMDRWLGGYVCYCKDCGSREGRGVYISIRGAVDAWNRRALPPAVVMLPAALPDSWADQLPPVPTRQRDRAAWLLAAWNRLVELARRPPPATDEAA